jgi:hypothetical protein
VRSEAEATSIWRGMTRICAAAKTGRTVVVVVAGETLNAAKFAAETWSPTAVETSLPHWVATWHQCCVAETGHDARTD